MKMTKSKIDLEKRTLAFGLVTLKMLRGVPSGVEFKSIRRQLTHSATAIGVLYREANRTVSQSDYVCRLAAVQKAAVETEFWLSLIEGLEERIPGVGAIHEEAMELVEIFNRLRQTAENSVKE